MQRRLIDDCFVSDKDRLTHSEALSILKANAVPLTGIESITLDKASNRILAEDILAPRPIPAHDNAAVDGFSFAYEDYSKEAGSSFTLDGRVAAGDAEMQITAPNTSARIFTGAIMPRRHDTVVMQEDTEINSHENGRSIIIIPSGLKPGANCRLKGEDTKSGATLCKISTNLKPQNIAAIASSGIGEIKVYAPLSVAFFSTGDEIIPAGTPFNLGKVYDANGPMLGALASRQSTSITNLGILTDDAKAVKTALLTASTSHQILITSGGASKGEEDYIVECLKELGTCHMWQLAIKPGRPMTFGQIGDMVFIGLPGNPVAAFICYLLYVSPLLNRLAGGKWPKATRYQVRADFSVNAKKPDRREFLRGTLKDIDGDLSVQKYQQDGSGLIRSLTLSDGLIELDEQTTSVEKGDMVHFIPYSEFGL